jgi:hypothetical protein
MLWVDAGHLWHIRLVEGKLCNTTSLHLRVECNAHQLTHSCPPECRFSIFNSTFDATRNRTTRRSLTPVTWSYRCSHNLYTSGNPGCKRHICHAKQRIATKVSEMLQVKVSEICKYACKETSIFVPLPHMNLWHKQAGEQGASLCGSKTELQRRQPKICI